MGQGRPQAPTRCDEWIRDKIRLLGFTLILSYLDEWSAPYTFVGGEARNSVGNGPNRTSGDVVAAGPVLHFWHCVQQCMQCLRALWTRTTLRHHQFDFNGCLPSVPTVPLFQRPRLIGRHPSNIRRTSGNAPVYDPGGPPMLRLGKNWGLLCCGWLHCNQERMGSHLRIRRVVYRQLC